MEFLKQLEQLFKDVEYLKERDRITTHTIQMLLEMIPDQVKGYVPAVKFIGVSRSTMVRLVERNKITHSYSGKVISFAMKDLLAYKESRLIKGNSSLPSISKL